MDARFIEGATAAPALPPGRKVELPGRGTTFVHESKSLPGAPTLVLLHGLGATAPLNWYTSLSALEHRFHVVAPDLRGHGRGIRAATCFTLEDAADDVIALADALELGRFVAVGYSLGGPIAKLLWRRHRDRVSGLVLCATSSSFQAAPLEYVMFAVLPAVEQLCRVVPDFVARRVIAQALRSHLEPTGFVEWALRELLLREPRTIVQAAAALGRYRGGDWISQIDVPTSVLVHTRDQLVPPRRQFELATAIPGARVHFVDADHFAAVRDPQTFVRALIGAIHDVTFAYAAETGAVRRAS
ncbi:MAG TPA: alpha/beta hydrolase [Acidimicrobiia bacterium]